MHTHPFPHSLQLAIENLDHFTVMGVAEMWELSLLVLHQKVPNFHPDLSEFQLARAKVVTPGTVAQC